MNKYDWTVQPVEADRVPNFAARLEQTLNQVEASGFEVDDIMDAPGGRQEGVVVIGKRPRKV